MVALVKLLTETIPTREIVFTRSFFGLFPNLVMVVASGSLCAALRTNHPFMHVKRALFSVGVMFLWFSTLKYLQLPYATAIAYSMQLIALILAYFILQEVIRIYRWSEVVAGFIFFASTVVKAFALIFVYGLSFHQKLTESLAQM